MPTISELHDEIFEYLNNWSEGSPTPLGNRFFYLRTKEDARFKKGYWFPGDDSYIALSFWTGGDAFNKTPNIYLCINPKKGIEAYLVAKDSENKKKYFEMIASNLQGYKPNTNHNVWKKTFSRSVSRNFLNTIDLFIETDKNIIDDILRKTLERIDEPDAQLLEDEYSSKFGFISEEQFYKLKSRVESEKIRIQRDKKIEKLIVNDLPIALVSISIEKFQGVNKTDINDLPTNAKWIFLTGENGFGKTSVLQAIALGLTNYDENRKYVKEGRINIRYKRNDDIISNSSAFSNSNEFKSLNENFIAYGPIRLNSQASSSESDENRNSSNVYNLFNKDGLLKNVNYLLQVSSLKNNREYDNLRNAIIQVVDKKIIDIHIDKDGEVKYYEADNNGNLLGTNRLDNLATGFQGLINLVGDIIFRFSKEYPNQNYADYEGIVLIDELENHLHPIFQKRVPLLLSNIFSKLQFIASIHSPIPLLGAPKESIIVKVNRTQKDGISIERIDDEIDFINLLPNTILTSPIFGLQEIFSINRDPSFFIRPETTYNEVKENDQENEKIKEFLSSENADELLKLFKK